MATVDHLPTDRQGELYHHGSLQCDRGKVRLFTNAAVDGKNDKQTSKQTKKCIHTHTHIPTRVRHI